MGQAEFRRRRQRLMRLMEPGSVAVVPGARVALRNRDTQYPFRQDSDFYYLTGFTEPDAALVLAPGRAHAEVILFCTERDPAHEQWHGEVTGPERAAELFGMDDAFPIGDLADILPGLLECSGRVYVDLGQNPEFERELMTWLNMIRRRRPASRAPEFAALGPILHDLRLYKSTAEQKLLRRAAEITAGAHRRAMSTATPGLSEADLEAELVHEFIRNGARHAAYPCIVGAGSNACVLHYGKNDGPLRDGDLVLIDAACEYQYYAADLSRTFPVNGCFTPAQRALYEVVLVAQMRAIGAALPGAGFNRPHEIAVEILIEGMKDLGLLTGSHDEIVAARAHQRFCAPTSSHWLGLDVHDVGDYRVDAAWRELEPGMVMTIEPGIYVPETAEVAAEFRGTGIRIEDVILVTPAGNQVLTAAAPKQIADIEALMAEARECRARARSQAPPRLEPSIPRARGSIAAHGRRERRSGIRHGG
jgi:Xaa-Pro aminopeptidase